MSRHTGFPALTVARYTLTEALRSGLPWLAAIALAAAVSFAAFLARAAIAEGPALQTAAGAALLRACAVFLAGIYVAGSVAREINDKGVELVLALPISRPVYYAGKLIGFCCVGAILALLFALPLLAWARPADVAAWVLSLAVETALVAALALFFASALTQTVSAIAATAGLYLLGRSMETIQAIARDPLTGETLHDALRWIVDALAFALPRLEAATRSDWLLYGAPPLPELAQTLGGMALYALLLSAAGLFDFVRRNF